MTNEELIKALRDIAEWHGLMFDDYEIVQLAAGRLEALAKQELVELTQREVYAIAQQEAWNQGQERSIDYSMISWLENNGVVFARRGS